MANEPLPGPYKSTTTKVIKLSNLEFSVNETTEATHVPAPCNCGGQGDGLLDLLRGFAEAAARSQAGDSPPQDVGS